MPYIGLSPFLHGRVHSNGNNTRCVNALHRAIPISTLRSINPLPLKYCVNALHRAIPISTEVHFVVDSIEKVCQCPTSGYPHFYTRYVRN